MVDGLSQDRETAGCIGVYDKQQVCPLAVLSAHSTGGLSSFHSSRTNPANNAILDAIPSLVVALSISYVKFVSIRAVGDYI